MPAVNPVSLPSSVLQRPNDRDSALALSSSELFERARARGREQGSVYAGSLYPPEAWALLQAGEATLVDVRTFEELKFVGQVPGSAHIVWQSGPALIPR